MSERTARSGGALVTGAAGFVGQHLVRALLGDGQGVTGLDVRPRPATLPADLPWEQVDIRHAEAVTAAVAAVRPSVVYHLAAQVSVVASMRDPYLDMETNVLGTVHVGAAAAAAGVSRLVFVSTGGALFGADAPETVDEQTRAHPTSVYGSSKLTAERLLPRVAGGVPLSVVRPGNIYGPGQDPAGEAGVIAIFTARMLRGEPVTIFGDGSQVRDYVYVADVVEAIRLAARRPPATCVVGTGVATTTRTLFDELAALTGYAEPPRIEPPRPGEVQRITLRPDHARAAWGWEPATSLRAGLADTVAAMRAASG